ncbi:MAG: hypothetical protein DCF30_19970 [Hyphomicrobiales bacterium]|nr:MAG: hypothetical protein DCF30_19970 [Hyphomicrobiales bacterium]
MGVSRQWAVGSGQWAVGSGQWAVDTEILPDCLLPIAYCPSSSCGTAGFEASGPCSFQKRTISRVSEA